MLFAVIKTMRPRQWTKNIVIFAALVFDRQLGLNNLPPMLRTIGGFVVFCLLSGLVYIINDIVDVELTANTRINVAGQLLLENCPFQSRGQWLLDCWS